MNRIINGNLHYINCQPSAYDSLGEIDWFLTKEQAVCPKHGKVQLTNVVLEDQYYDGCSWQQPKCPVCGHIFSGLPFLKQERSIVLARRQ